ncbi:MAG: DUF3794 domain-containing protein [bacterium]
MSEKIVYQEQQQLLVNEIIKIPPNKPAVKEIITARIVARITDQEALQHCTLLQGAANITIFYLSHIIPLETMQAQMDFSYKLPIKDLKPEDQVKTKLRVEDFQLVLINTTTIEIKIIFLLQNKIINLYPPAIPRVNKDFLWTSAYYLN